MSEWGYADVTSLNRETLQRERARVDFDARTVLPDWQLAQRRNHGLKRMPGNKSLTIRGAGRDWRMRFALVVGQKSFGKCQIN